MKINKIIIAIILTLCIFPVSCTTEKSERPVNVNVSILTGPTGIGSVNLWKSAEEGQTSGKYTFSVAKSPDEIVAKISKGETDIAAISTNLAAKLYKKTNGGIKILAVNTLGVLNVLDNTGAEIGSLADLRGRKIYTTGQGSNPEYIINYLFGKISIDTSKDVTIEYVADGTELVAVWAKEPEAIIIAPQPVATSVLMKYEGSRNVLSLTEEWDKISEGSALMMGCIVVRTDFLKKNRDSVDKFLEEYAKSVNSANNDIEGTAVLCETYGLIAKSAIAKKAIPECNICCITGEGMKTKLTGYLQILYDADNASIGAMPDENFWY